MKLPFKKQSWYVPEEGKHKLAIVAVELREGLQFGDAVAVTYWDQDAQDVEQPTFTLLYGLGKDGAITSSSNLGKLLDALGLDLDELAESGEVDLTEALVGLSFTATTGIRVGKGQMGEIERPTVEKVHKVDKQRVDLEDIPF